MGIFEQFPYTNFHDLNLDWILHAIRSMDKKLDEFVASNVLSYADPIQWDIETQYAKNTVVVDPKTGTAYMSINPVPVGQLLTNKYYWQPIFNYNETITALKKQIAAEDVTETNGIVQKDINVGDWVWYGNILYEATKKIETGGKIIPDSNTSAVTVEDAIKNINNKITSETAARESADTDLNNKITSETAARESADTDLNNKITSETAARESADTDLNNKITSETAARESADTDLNNKITSETAARESADTDLENKIKSLDFIPSNEVYNDMLIAEFHNEDDGQAEFYTSVDGYNFNKIPTNFKINGRDGSLVFLNDTFYLASTWYSDNLVDFQFAIYTSNDFVNWVLHTVKVNNATGRTWAPDLYINGDTLEVYFSQESVNNSGIFQAYKCTCTDINTLAFSAPIKLTGTPNNVIDAHRFDFNGPRVIIKDETNKKIVIYTLNGSELINPIDVTSFTFPIEGPTTAVMGGYLYIMCDRFLDYGKHKYFKQTPVVTRTSDLVNFEKVVECHTNKKWSGLTDFSRSRHGCYYKPSTKALEIIKSNYEIMAASNYEIENSSIEHINIEDLDMTNWTLFPNTVYCVFNNPSSSQTNTTNITISEPHNPYELDHYDLFIECNVGKIINIKSRNITYHITATAQNYQTCIHFIRGIDGYFLLVGPHD